MTMKRLWLGSVAIVALAGGGLNPDVAAAQPFNGCYVGAHSGFGWGQNTNDFGKAVRSGPTEELASAFDFEFGPFNHPTSGGVFGVQGGCQTRIPIPNGPLLIGVEGELFWSGIKGGYTAKEDLFFPPPPFPPGTGAGDPGTFSRFESRNLWDADIALRVGWVVNPFLLYGKLGLALAQFSYTETHDDFPTTHACPGLVFVGGMPINGQCSVSFTQTRLGLLLGIGAEWAFTNHWTAKVEYDYIDYGCNSLPYPSAAAAIQSFSVCDTKQIVKVGLNFYF